MTQLYYFGNLHFLNDQYEMNLSLNCVVMSVNCKARMEGYLDSSVYDKTIINDCSFWKQLLLFSLEYSSMFFSTTSRFWGKQN